MPKGVEFEQQCSYDANYEEAVTRQSDEKIPAKGCRISSEVNWGLCFL